MHPRFRIGLAATLAALTALPAGAADIVYLYDALGRLVEIDYPSGKGAKEFTNL